MGALGAGGELVGLSLPLPPVAGVLRLEVELFGVPLTLGHLCAVWTLLLAAAAAAMRTDTLCAARSWH